MVTLLISRLSRSLRRVRGVLVLLGALATLAAGCEHLKPMAVQVENRSRHGAVTLLTQPRGLFTWVESVSTGGMAQLPAVRRDFRGELRGTYTIQQASNNRYVDAHDTANQDYRLVTRSAQNDDSQRWSLMPLGNETYTIQQASTRRFVDAHETASLDYRLVTRPAQNNDSQRWRLGSLGNDRYTIQQASTGRFVDAYETPEQDYRLVTRPAQNNDSQRWLIRVR